MAEAGEEALQTKASELSGGKRAVATAEAREAAASTFVLHAGDGPRHVTHPLLLAFWVSGDANYDLWPVSWARSWAISRVPVLR